MSLIPGTLPSGACYGTPQELLDLFAQYLDVPAFAVSSKVLYSATSPMPNTDFVWVDTAGSTTPILKLYNEIIGDYQEYPFQGQLSPAGAETLISGKSAITTLASNDLFLVSQAGTSAVLKKITWANVTSQIPSSTITPAMLSQPLTRGTAVASTSGTSIDFTGIPSWAKRITVMFQGVSTSGSSSVIIRLGTSSGFISSGYLGSSSLFNFSSGILIDDIGNAAAIRHGIVQILNITGNSWVSAGSMGRSDSTGSYVTGGSISLASALTQIRITTGGGTDTFDAGSINIIYEG